MLIVHHAVGSARTNREGCDGLEVSRVCSAQSKDPPLLAQNTAFVVSEQEAPVLLLQHGYASTGRRGRQLLRNTRIGLISDFYHLSMAQLKSLTTKDIVFSNFVSFHVLRSLSRSWLRISKHSGVSMYTVVADFMDTQSLLLSYFQSIDRVYPLDTLKVSDLLSRHSQPMALPEPRCLDVSSWPPQEFQQKMKHKILIQELNIVVKSTGCAVMVMSCLVSGRARICCVEGSKSPGQLTKEPEMN